MRVEIVPHAVRQTFPKELLIVVVFFVQIRLYSENGFRTVEPSAIKKVARGNFFLAFAATMEMDLTLPGHYLQHTLCRIVSNTPTGHAGAWNVAFASGGAERGDENGHAAQRSDHLSRMPSWWSGSTVRVCQRASVVGEFRERFIQEPMIGRWKWTEEVCTCMYKKYK